VSVQHKAQLAINQSIIFSTKSTKLSVPNTQHRGYRFMIFPEFITSTDPVSAGDAS